MNTGKGVLSINRFRTEADWKLLVFLLLFMNVKIVVKLLAVLLIYVLQPNLRLGLRLKNSRLPLFYPGRKFFIEF